MIMAASTTTNTTTSIAASAAISLYNNIAFNIINNNNNNEHHHGGLTNTIFNRTGMMMLVSDNNNNNNNNYNNYNDNNNKNNNNNFDQSGGGGGGDENTFFTLRYTFSIIRLCLAVFGVLANSVTCYVLTYKKLWSPTSLLLLTLVLYDAVFLLASIPLCLVDAFIQVNMETFAVICGVLYPIRYMAQTGSIYTLGTLTIERYLIVLRPFKARIFCSFGKIKRFIIVIFCFSIVFNIPRCFFYTLATSFTPTWPTNMTSLSNNSTSSFLQQQVVTSDADYVIDTPTDVAEPINGEQHGHVVVGDDVYSSNSQSESDKRREFYLWLYTRVYELYISSTFLYLLPYALIPLLNVQLLLAIKQRRLETRSISLKGEHKLKKTRATNREDGLTMIVLGITVCFFVCCLVPAIYNVTQIARMEATSHFSFYLLIASDTMLCLNASTDFFFYCLLGAKFRNTFLHIFCQKSDCVRRRWMGMVDVRGGGSGGGGGTGRSPLTSGHSRYSDTCYHTVL